MTYSALSPVKTLQEAKSRLAGHLTQYERTALVLDMLHHVLDVLCSCKIFERISVVSPDPTVLERVQAWGAQALIEEEQGHNPALYAAALRELTTGTTALLTLSADLPLLQASDISSMIEYAKQYDVVLAPSRDGTGTNAFLVHPPLALPYLFGVGSLQRYITQAKQQHLSSVLVQSIGFALDIDTIEDLEMFRQYEREANHTTPLLYHLP